MYNEERHGRIDYMGYIRPRQRGCRFMEPHNKEQLITFQFQWEDNMKPVSTRCPADESFCDSNLLTPYVYLMLPLPV